MQAIPTTPEAFLREFEFPHDEPGSGSLAAGRQTTRGVSPLFLAVVLGNTEVTRALARANPTGDVTAQLKSDFPTLVLWVGCEPIHAAGSFSVTNHAPIVAALLEASSDPNAAARKVGIYPLYSAAVLHNSARFQALLSAAGDRLKMEKKKNAFSDTALGKAAYLPAPAIVDSLLAANAPCAVRAKDDRVSSRKRIAGAVRTWSRSMSVRGGVLFFGLTI